MGHVCKTWSQNVSELANLKSIAFKLATQNNDVLVFGANNYGQLGLGHNDDQNKPIILMQ